MNRLIVQDTLGHELVNREMLAAGRYEFYAAWSSGDLVTFAGRRYRLHSVTWTRPDMDCVLFVSFDSYEPVNPSPEC